MRRRTGVVLGAVVLAAGAGAGCAAAPAPVPEAPGAVPPPAVVAAPSGFGVAVAGGQGHTVFVVRTLADAGPGSVRDALARARAAGGGIVRFAIGGDVMLTRPLEVPAHTTLDGGSAPPPGITLWGGRVTGGGGVVNVFASDVIVRGLRIRNAANDGIQIAPKRGQPVSGVVVDHCSITNSRDGGIDVTGRNALTVDDVTLSWNYVAGSGSACPKGTCGGGALVKYGVGRISIHANLWDKNLRRNPTVVGGAGVASLADIRGNVVLAPAQSIVQVRAGARANVVGNYFDRPRAVFFPDAFVHAADNEPVTFGNEPEPFPVVAPLAPIARAEVVAGAGAQPRDAIDRRYLGEVATWAELKALAVGPAGTVVRR